MSSDTQPPAGWYPDPSTPGSMRWWDGTRWTDQTSAPALPASYGGSPYASGGQQLPEVGDFLGQCFRIGTKGLVLALPLVLGLAALVVLLGGVFFARGEVDEWLADAQDTFTTFETEADGSISVEAFPPLDGVERVTLGLIGITIVVGSSLVYIVGTLAMHDAIVEAEPRFPSMSRVLPALGRGILLVLLAFAASLVAIVALTLLFVVTGGLGILLLPVVFGLAVWVGIRVSLTFPILAIEGGVWSAVTQSWSRTRGQFWGIFGRVLLYGLILSIIGQVVGAVGGQLASLGVRSGFAISALLSLAVQMVSTLYNAAPFVILYHATKPTGPELSGQPGALS